MRETWMPIERWRMKKLMIHIHNGILLSHKKGHVWVSSDEMDKSRAYYTEWSKSEREIQIVYTDAYIWNLERCYWWINFQGSNEETHMENIEIWRTGEGRGWDYGESNMKIYNTICKIDSQWEFAITQTGALWQPRRVGWGRRWEGGSRRVGWDMGIPMIDSSWCMTESHKIL